MLNCTTDKYDDIYAPWVNRSENLLRLAGYKHGDKLLDLCGGTGAVCKATVFFHTNVKPADLTLLDLNPRCRMRTVKQVKGKAEDVGIHFYPNTFDVIVCRQAMGYLNPHQVIPGIFTVLKPGGRFVFATFVRPRRYGFKVYNYQNSRYLETHLFALGRILHLQWRIGVGADVTMFQYHSREKLEKLLDPWFRFQVFEKGRSLRWVCTKTGGRLRSV